MKFVFNVEKLKSHQIGLVRAHNLREGDKNRTSQVDEAGWFSKSERVEVVAWNQERLAEARALSKRKDAVEALSFVVQIGNQADWRESSTIEFPTGRPKRPPPTDPLKMADAVKKWAAIEFGKENVVSLELHLDESTPHVHLIVTPIFEQKLQSKKWLNGPKSVATLRSKAHELVNSVIPCSYEPGRGGGEPHDAGRAAGGVRSENVASVVKTASGLIAALTGRVSRENEQLIEENLMLKQENQRLKTVNAGLRTGGSGARMVAAEALAAAEAEARATRAEAAAAEAERRVAARASEARVAAAVAEAAEAEARVVAQARAAEQAAEARVAAAEARVAEERRYAATRVVAAQTRAAELAEQLNVAIQKNENTEILEKKIRSLELDLSHSRMCEKESADAAAAWMNEFIALRDAPKNTKAKENGMDLD